MSAVKRLKVFLIGWLCTCCCPSLVALIASVSVTSSNALICDVTAAEPGLWPTYRHDNRRSGVSREELEFPLRERWVWQSPQPPQTAWSGPAKWDAYSGNSGLQSMRNFDPCFFVTADEDAVYFGSSADDAVHALDATTGVESWVFFTGGPVRFPPTIDEDRLLFGSDDGCVYCCEKSAGKELWRKEAGPNRARILNDRKLISKWPVRTGVLLEDGRATFAGSLVPWETSYVWTVLSTDGDSEAKGCYRREVKGVTLQGALLASSKLLYVPQGRAAPLAFRRDDGLPRGSIGEAGGVFCILTEDEMLFAGPKDQKSPKDEIRIADLNSKGSIATFAGTNRILIDGKEAWLSIGGELRSLNREDYLAAQKLIDRARDDMKNGRHPAELMKRVIERGEQRQADCWRWKIASPAPLEMIKAGNVLFVGLDGSVRAYSAVDGHEIWQAAIEGSAHGLAIAGGQLYVSTEKGHIYAFGSDG